MNYSDKACTDAALNVNPANGKVFLYDNASVDLGGNTYIALGSIGSETVKSINISLLLSTNMSSSTTGIWVVGSNLLLNSGHKARYIIVDFDNKKLNILVDSTLHTWDFTVSGSANRIGFWVTLNYQGAPVSPTLSNCVFSNYASAESIDIGNDFVFIGAYKNAEGTMVTSTAFDSAISLRPIILFENNSASPVHRYALSEVTGNIVYDSAGSQHGRLIASSIDTIRVRSNYVFANNTFNGFREDTNSAEPISSAKIPLNKDLCVYKSTFETNTAVDTWTGSPNSVIDGKLVVNAHRASNNCRVQLVDTRLKSSQIGRTLKVKYKLSNLNALKMTHVSITVGSAYAESYGLGYTKPTKSLVSLAQGESIEKELILLKGDASGTNFANLIQVYSTYESALEVDTQAFSIDYLEIYQTDTLVDYPMVEFGKNASESHINFGNIVNIPELSFLNTQLDNLFTNVGPNPKDWIWKNPDPSMGAETGSGWDITSAPTEIVTNGLWRSAPNRVLYCKNHDAADLPEGISSAIDLRTNSPLTSSSTANIFNCTQSMRPWSYIQRPSFHAKVSCWVKVNPAITSGSVLFQVGFHYNLICSFQFTANNNYMNHEWVKVEFDNPNAITLGRNINTALNLYFGITANSGTVEASIPWLLAIADLQFEAIPTNNFLSPIYADYDLETNSIKNIKLYQKNLEKYYPKNLSVIGNNNSSQYCVDGSIDHTRVMNTLK